MRLSEIEVDLIGAWRKEKDGSIVPDSTCKRIEKLIQEHLCELGSDSSGWDVLYRDPRDRRLWELTYPQSDTEGGGAPRLTLISEEVAKHKYGSEIVDVK